MPTGMIIKKTRTLLTIVLLLSNAFLLTFELKSIDFLRINAVSAKPAEDLHGRAYTVLKKLQAQKNKSKHRANTTLREAKDIYYSLVLNSILSKESQDDTLISLLSKELSRLEYQEGLEELQKQIVGYKKRQIDNERQYNQKIKGLNGKNEALRAKILLLDDKIKEGVVKFKSTLLSHSQELKRLQDQNLVLKTGLIALSVCFMVAFLILALKKKPRKAINVIRQYFSSKNQRCLFDTVMTCEQFKKLQQAIENKDDLHLISSQLELFEYISHLKNKNKLFRASETLIRLDQDILNQLGIDLFLEYLILIAPGRMSKSVDTELISKVEKLSVSQEGSLESFANDLNINTISCNKKDWIFELAHVFWAKTYSTLIDDHQKLTFIGLQSMSERPMDNHFRWSGDGKYVERLYLPYISLQENNQEILSIQGEGKLS